LYGIGRSEPEREDQPTTPAPVECTNASGYTKRSRVEAAVGRYKQVIGDGLRFHEDERRAIEVGVAIHVLNRMLELGRPISVRVA
jgi:hypothetical protein